MVSTRRGPPIHAWVASISANLTRPFQIISNAIVVFVVQCFFIRRIWVLGEYKNKLPCILSVIALTILGAAMFIGTKDAGHQSFSGFHGM